MVVVEEVTDVTVVDVAVADVVVVETVVDVNVVVVDAVIDVVVSVVVVTVVFEVVVNETVVDEKVVLETVVEVEEVAVVKTLHAMAVLTTPSFGARQTFQPEEVDEPSESHASSRLLLNLTPFKPDPDPLYLLPSTVR